MLKNSKIKTALIIFLFLSILLNLFILINAFISGDESAATSFWIADILATIINYVKSGTININNIEAFSYFIRKLVGHFSLFLLDGIFVGLTFYLFLMYKKSLNFWCVTLFIFLIGLLVASISEAIQLGIPGRIGTINDVLIDMAGYAVSLIALFIIFFFTLRKKKFILN